MINYWVTSDTHYSHTNIIKYCDRPFPDATTMNACMVTRYNAVVRPGDVVWHLGDVTFFWKGWETLVKNLHGTRHLILGNHDREKKLKPYFASIQTRKLLIVDGIRLYMSHRPCLDRVSSFQLHGHRHSKPDAILNRRLGTLDVGVDGHEFRPWALDEITTLVRRTVAEIETEDRHLHTLAGNIKFT